MHGVSFFFQVSPKESEGQTPSAVLLCGSSLATLRFCESSDNQTRVSRKDAKLRKVIFGGSSANLNDFSVAQAFTPGGMKGGSLKAPFNGALIAPAGFSPRRKRLG
jgi:hypothetical protein